MKWVEFWVKFMKWVEFVKCFEFTKWVEFMKCLEFWIKNLNFCFKMWVYDMNFVNFCFKIWVKISVILKQKPEFVIPNTLCVINLVILSVSEVSINKAYLKFFGLSSKICTLYTYYTLLFNISKIIIDKTKIFVYTLK